MEKRVPKYLEMIGRSRGRFDLRATAGWSLQLPEGMSAKELQGATPATLADLLPGKGDFINVNFRAISARYLGEGGYFLDFSKEGMLMAALPLFLPRERGGARLDHLKLVDNHSRDRAAILAAIVDARWSGGSEKTPSPGIEVTAALDWKFRPEIARGMLSQPALYDNFSISFDADFEKSHPDLDDWEFFAVLGHQVDGETVRIIVTEMLSVNHVGLVDAGGDAHAKIVGVERELQQDGRSGKGGQTRGDEMKFELSGQQVQEFGRLLQMDEALTAEGLLEAVTALAESNEALRAEQATLKAKAKAYDEMLKARREAVKTLLGQAREGKANSGLERAIERMELAELAEMEKDLQAELDAAFALRCQACGGTDIQRRSSKQEEPKNGGGPGVLVDFSVYRTR